MPAEVNMIQKIHSDRVTMISELLLTCLKLRNIQYDCLYRNTKLSFPFPHIPAS